MSNIEKKEKNLNQLIDKLNSLSLSYSQPTYEIEKIRTEKNELSRNKNEIEKNKKVSIVEPEIEELIGATNHTSFLNR